MTTKTRTIRHRRSDSAKSRCQQRNRRKIQLFLKAYEYCQECNADISLTIRLRHSGEIVFLIPTGPGHRQKSSWRRTIQGANRSLGRKLRLDISPKNLTQTSILEQRVMWQYCPIARLLGVK
ncbi:hypothetical protein BDV32DRAFT_90473 [Aspergillus pseudonomiae]|nr:hypothetical protein BDV32DRAFT_90473 [Aspergillus pseudonomiae]